MQFSKTEITKIIIASIITGFVFSFNQWGDETFSLTIGLLNLSMAVFICLIIYTVHALSQKIAALKSACETEFDLITAKKISYKISMGVPKYLRYIGPIITILISLLSNGKALFIAIATFNEKVIRSKRIGFKWTNLKESELGMIAFAGPLSNLILLVIFKALVPISPVFFSKAVFISSTLAIFHLLPLPKFDGIKIFFGSRILYLFALSFAIILIVLVNITNALLSTVIALIIALSAALYFFYISNK